MTTTSVEAFAGPLPRIIRVASVPSGHVYVDHITDPDGADAVFRLADPPSTDPTAGVGQWWPPAMLEASWIDDHHDEFDVFHLQFGFDALTPGQLLDAVAALRRAGRPLVYTVHDLRNPHHEHRREHDAQLDMLIPNADALITLTDGAAAAIEARWGRAPVVLAHPHVVDLDRMSAPRPAHDGFVVGVHAKSLRASAAPLPVIRALSRLVTQLPDARLQVNLHREVLDAGHPRHDPALIGLLQQAHSGCELDLRVHDPLSDDELWTYLQGLDVSVLPYRFGTHSGWLEACYDLGTTAVAPSCGYFAQQQPCLGYRHDDSGLDVASLDGAVRTAYHHRPRWQADATRRRQERAGIAAAHRAVYESLLE